MPRSRPKLITVILNEVQWGLLNENSFKGLAE